LNAAKVTVKYANNQTEEFLLKNGVEFADYNGTADVPGSKFVPNLVPGGRQVRSFSRDLKQTDQAIQSITLESFDNQVAPVFVAITAETGSSPNPASSSKPAEIPIAGFPPGNGKRVLIVGGGSSHDFEKWFNQADSQILTEAGFRVRYTGQPPELETLLKETDILYLANNQPLPAGKVREEVFNFSKKGLLLVHPALWYNWKDWPEYNSKLVGGGSRGHDKYGPFEVTVTEPNHPVMAGVDAKFSITDELYYSEKDPQGSPIQVLATGQSPISGKAFPVVWITDFQGAKVVCITLGHDGKAHQHPAYKKLLANSVKWLSQQP
jgi:type 1 glutamine amidotransferase